MRVVVVTASIAGREHMLEECKESVASQTYPVRHLVGDGTGCPEAYVLNELIYPTDCDAYIVLNDDDLLCPTYVERCVDKLNGHDVVYAWPLVEGRDVSFNIDFTSPPGDFPITALIRKTLYEQVGGYVSYESGAGSEGADGVFWERARQIGARFTHVPEFLWTYRFHGDNMSMKRRDDVMRERR